jgi:peptide/nickel transport system permease protein
MAGEHGAEGPAPGRTRAVSLLESADGHRSVPPVLGPAPAPVAAMRAPTPVAPAASGGRRHFAVRQLVRYGVTLFLLVTLVFFLPRALPGDPLQSYEDAATALPADTRAEYLAHYGLDRPLVEQYVRYLSATVRLDLGDSIAFRKPVKDLVADRLPWTMLLVGTALAMSALLSYFAGVASAWVRGSLTDRVTVAAMTVIHAVPEYALATLLLITFSVRIRIFPVAGGSTPFSTDFTFLHKVVDVVVHLVLPATALALGMLGTKFLLVRNTMVSVLGQDYMLLAEAKGLPERLLKYRHAGRNALLPFLNIVGVQVGLAAGSALFVETVFGYPGLASLLVPAVGNLDYPLIEGCFLFLAAMTLTANLLVDLVSARVDPRVRR